MLVKNEDQRPKDYSETDLYPRPSHADYTYLEKYGIKASSGGGRSSARETIGRVAAGAIAELYLRQVHGVSIVAFVSSVGKINLPAAVGEHSAEAADDENDEVEDALTPEFRSLLTSVSREDVDAHPTRCPHPETAERMTKVRSQSPRQKTNYMHFLSLHVIQSIIIHSVSSVPRTLSTL